MIDIDKLESQLAEVFPEAGDRYVDVVRRNQAGYYIAMRHESRPGIAEFYLKLDEESLAVLSEIEEEFHWSEFPTELYRR